MIAENGFPHPLVVSCVAAVVLLTTLAAAQAEPVKLYVSPAGNDAWSGKLPEARQANGPFATLARAQAEVRRLVAAGAPAGGITVFVRAGTYELAAPLALGLEDSGAGCPVTYRAYAGERPVLRGARKVTGFKPYQGKILQASLQGTPLQGVAFRQLFFQGERQIMARYPNVDPKDPHFGEWAHVLAVDGDQVKDHFTCTNDVIKNWTRLDQAQVCIHPAYGWAWSVVPIKSVDRATATIVLGQNVAYDMQVGDRYYVQNLLEELDSPGEWYFDRGTSTLYFWPPSELRDGDVVAPTLADLVVMKGARNVTVRGFALEDCDGDAVEVRDCEGCIVGGCVIRNCGGWGVTIAGGHKSGAFGNDIFATGAGGVSLDGGDRKTLERGDNFATNNYIHHIAAFQKTYNTGVNVNGVGNLASHNLIHDTYHAGLLMGGNDNVVEYNVIHHTNLGSEDTGGLYMSSRDWSERGCVIRYNIFHHCGGFGKASSWQPVRDGKVEFTYPHFTWAIYLDAPTTGNVIYGNVIWSAPIWGLFNASGRENIWENNIIVGSPAFQAYTMGDDWSCWPDMFRLLKQAQQPGSPYLKHYPELAGYNEVRPGAMRDVRLVRNIIYYSAEDGQWLRGQEKESWQGGQLLYSYASHPDDFARNEFDYNTVYAPAGIDLKIKFQRGPGDPWQTLSWPDWQKLGTDAHSQVADPLFVDPAHHDYRLKPDSPALKLGFKPIPFEKIGPYQDEMRASWPVVEAPGVSALGDFTTVQYFKLPGYEPAPAREFVPRQGAAGFFAKLAAKQPVKIVVFAGGNHAQGGWRPALVKWLKERTPGADISDVDASICGCVRGSGFSVYRFGTEVLNRKPDLVFIDFASDDSETDTNSIWAAIEGVVRQAWQANPALDLVFVYAFRPGYEESYGKDLSPGPVSAYEKLADRYGIASINMGFRVAQMAREGKLVIKASAEEAKQLQGKVVFTHDGVYTTPEATDLYAQIIGEDLVKLGEASQAGEEARHVEAVRKPPFYRQNLERARQVAITPAMLGGKWEKLTPENIGGRNFFAHFNELWYTTTPGAKLTFKFKGTAASLFDLMGPDTGRVKVTVDGQDRGTRQQVDPWAYYQRLASLDLANGLEDREHVVTVELLPEAPDRSVPIEAAKKASQYKPDDFKGVALRLGWIRMIGEPVE